MDIPVGRVDYQEFFDNYRKELARKKRLNSADPVGFLGICMLERFDSRGRLVQREVEQNIICTAGKNKVLLASGGSLLSTFKYMAVGTSSTTPVIGDTALGAQVAISAAITPTNPSSPILQFQNTFVAGVATGALVEAGLLDASSSGALLSHLTYSVITVGASDSIQVTYQLS